MVWTVRSGKLVDVPATQGSVSAEPPPPDTSDTETDPVTHQPVAKGTAPSPAPAPAAAPPPGSSTTVPASQVPSGPPQGPPVPGTGGGVTTNAPMVDNGDGTFTDPSTGKRYPGHRSADVIGTRPDGSTGFVPGPIIITGTPIGGAGPRSGGGADPNFNPNNPPPPGVIQVNGKTFIVTPGVVQPDGSVGPSQYHEVTGPTTLPSGVSADTQAQIDAAKQKNLDDLAYQYIALKQQGKIAEAQNLLQKGVALGIIDGQPTLDAIIRKADIALKTGDLTGIYNNQSTVQAGAAAGFVTLPNGERVPTAQSTQAGGFIRMPDGSLRPTLAQGEATGMITLPDGRQVPSLRAGEAVGTVNGQPTLARGQLMGELNGVPTWQRTKETADITGEFGGQPTLQNRVYGAQYGGLWNGQPTVQVGEALGRIQGQNTLARDLGEAQSRREDVATNLRRQGQGWEQWMKERQDVEELGRNPQDWLSYAIRSGGGQVPQGVGLWDQLQRVNANRPENVEGFLNRQNQAPAKQAGAVPGMAAPAAPAPAPAAVPPTAAGALPAPRPDAMPAAQIGKMGNFAGPQGPAPTNLSAAVNAPTALVPNPGPSLGQDMGPDRHWHDPNTGQAIGIYDLGGTVPGTPDQHSLGVLQGGEQVIPPQRPIRPAAPFVPQAGVVQQTAFNPQLGAPDLTGNANPRTLADASARQSGGTPMYDMPQPGGMPQVHGDMLNQGGSPTPASPLDTGYGPAQPGRTMNGAGGGLPPGDYHQNINYGPAARIGAMNNFAAPAPPAGQAPTNLQATMGGQNAASIANVAPADVAGMAGKVQAPPQAQGQGNFLPTAGDFRKLPFLPGALRAAITPLGGATGAGGQGGNRWNGSGVSPYANRALGGFRPVAAQAARALNPSFIPALGTLVNQTGGLAQDQPWYRTPR